MVLRESVFRFVLFRFGSTPLLATVHMETLLFFSSVASSLFGKRGFR